MLSFREKLQASNASNVNMGSLGHSGFGRARPIRLPALFQLHRNFARAAAAGGLAEVELGRLADQNGKSPEARQFGQRMVDDHSKANSQLKELAAAANIPLPDAPGPEDQAMRERLDKMRRETPSTGTTSEAKSPPTRRLRNSSNMRLGRGRMRS